MTRQASTSDLEQDCSRSSVSRPYITPLQSDLDQPRHSARFASQGFLSHCESAQADSATSPTATRRFLARPPVVGTRARKRGPARAPRPTPRRGLDDEHWAVDRAHRKASRWQTRLAHKHALAPETVSVLMLARTLRPFPRLHHSHADGRVAFLRRFHPFYQCGVSPTPAPLPSVIAGCCKDIITLLQGPKARAARTLPQMRFQSPLTLVSATPVTASAEAGRLPEVPEGVLCVGPTHVSPRRRDVTVT